MSNDTVNNLFEQRRRQLEGNNCVIVNRARAKFIQRRDVFLGTEVGTVQELEALERVCKNKALHRLYFKPKKPGEDEIKEAFSIASTYRAKLLSDGVGRIDMQSEKVGTGTSARHIWYYARPANRYGEPSKANEHAGK